MRRSIDRHFLRNLSIEEERDLRLHLPTCEACRAYYQRHLLLSEIDPSARACKERIGAGLGLNGRPVRLRPIAALACFAAILGLLAVFFPAPSAYRARGGSNESAALQVYRVQSNGSSSFVGNVISASDELAFSYRNEAGFERLLVFGADEEGNVYWFYPAWQDVNTTPVAVPISKEPGVHELPEAIRHRYRGASLTVYAVFTNRAYSVRDIESSLSKGLSIADATIRKLEIEVVE